MLRPAPCQLIEIGKPDHFRPQSDEQNFLIAVYVLSQRRRCSRPGCRVLILFSRKKINAVEMGSIEMNVDE